MGQEGGRMRGDIVMDMRGLGVLKRITKVKKEVKRAKSGEIIEGGKYE